MRRGAIATAVAAAALVLTATALPADDARNKSPVSRQPDLVVVEDNLTIRGDGYLTWVQGEVLNRGILPASDVRVGLAVFDAAEELLSTSAIKTYGSICRRGESLVECIPPGETGWFQVGFPGAAERVEHTVSGYELDCQTAESPFEVTGIEVTEVQNGIELTGSIGNTGTKDVVHVSLNIGVRDPSGKLVSIGLSSIGGERIGGYSDGIRAGDTVAFEKWQWMPDADYGSHEIRISWREAGGNFRRAVAGIASTSGSQGATWRSSLSLLNRSGAAGQVALSYYHAAGIAEVEIDLADNQMASWDDVVGSLFEVAGTSAGFVHVWSDVPVTVTARTYNVTATAAASAGGSYGQLLPTLTQDSTLEWISKGVLSPVRGGEHFRSNIGLVNLSDRECRTDIRLYDAGAALVAELGQVSVPPRSWRQLNDAVPDGLEVGYATVEDTTGCSLWAYASVIDRATGDPITVSVDPETTISPPRPGGAVSWRGWFR